MTTIRRIATALVFAACLILTHSLAIAADSAARAGTLVLDPANTQIVFNLGGSLHTTHGTFQLKSGTIQADPATGKASGEIVIDAATAETNESMRDGIMKKSVLETASYPEISFTPETVHGTLNPDGAFNAAITGIMRIHGGAHQITLDTNGQLTGDHLTGSSKFTIPWVAWGMKDPSFLIFRVNDTVDVTFTTAGQVTWAVAGAAAGSDTAAASDASH